MYNNTTNILESLNPGEALSSMSAADYNVLPWSKGAGINSQVAVEYRPDIEKVFTTYSLEPTSDEESELIDNSISYKFITPRQVRTTKKPLHSIGGTFPHETENRRISVGRLFSFLILILRPSETSREARLDVGVNDDESLEELMRRLYASGDPACIASFEKAVASSAKLHISIVHKRQEILNERT